MQRKIYRNTYSGEVQIPGQTVVYWSRACHITQPSCPHTIAHLTSTASSWVQHSPLTQTPILSIGVA